MLPPQHQACAQVHATFRRCSEITRMGCSPTLLDQNLLRIVEPYSVVELEYVSECVGQGKQAVKAKLSQMILDKVFHGVLDQGRGCLLVFDDTEADTRYATAIDMLQQVGKVVVSLLGNSVWTFVASCTAFCISPIGLGLGFYSEDVQAIWADDNYARPEIIRVGLGFYSRFPEPDEADAVSDGNPWDPGPDISADSYPISCLSYGAPLRLRGGCHSDESELEDGDSDTQTELSTANLVPMVNLAHAGSFRLRSRSNSDVDDSENNAGESDEPESDSVGPSSKRKRKTAQPPRPRKPPSKGKCKASDDESDSEAAIRVTLGGKNGTKGMFVDEESYFYDAPEFWDVPSHRVAIILDVSDTPECLQGDRKLMSVT
ncbi:PCI-domain-containing protein [Mycena venus]|uniref:PCI-domain-containing protein n=1 Tax=Mycena venus TaxID=2733690 RepID=A0A8H7D2Q7_9AGAR|nr:PCI-domain-containing protein [Mycena venus]